MYNKPRTVPGGYEGLGTMGREQLERLIDDEGYVFSISREGGPATMREKLMERLYKHYVQEFYRDAMNKPAARRYSKALELQAAEDTALTYLERDAIKDCTTSADIKWTQLWCAKKLLSLTTSEGLPLEL